LRISPIWANNALFWGKNSVFRPGQERAWSPSEIVAIGEFHGVNIEHREKIEGGEAFQLREPGVSYHIDFGPKNDDIAAGNGYFWNTI
jgi:hypothetical protein